VNLDTVSVHPYQAPLAREYVSATARHEVREGLILRVQTDEGHIGLGEAAPLSNRTESLDRARKALETATSALRAGPIDARATVDDPAALSPALAEAMTARFAVELALLDVLARQADTPLAQWLTDEILDGRTPPASVPVNATIPATEPKHTRQQAENASIQGYDTIKLKATGEYATDRERVEAAREGAPDVDLRLDVNGAWPDLDTARQRMHELAEHDLEYVEQPLAPDAIDEMAQLRQTSPVPIAADEPVLGVESAKRIVQAEAADVLVLKPMVLGGAATTLSIARLAEAHDTPVVVTSTIDGAIARSGALHAAAALGELTHACGLATGPLIQREPAAFDERIERGTMPVPGAPGHGAWLSSSPEAP